MHMQHKTKNHGMDEHDFFLFPYCFSAMGHGFFVAVSVYYDSRVAINRNFFSVKESFCAIEAAEV